MDENAENALPWAKWPRRPLRLSGTSRLACGIMVVTAALVALVWAADPKLPVVGFFAELLQPVLYLLLTPLPVAWMVYSVKNPAISQEAKVLVFAALVPLNSYFLACLATLIRRLLPK